MIMHRGKEEAPVIVADRKEGRTSEKDVYNRKKVHKIAGR